MKKVAVVFDCRKCLRCGEVTKNMKKDVCRCGGYMYMTGGYYVPEVRKQGQKGGC